MGKFVPKYVAKWNISTAIKKYLFVSNKQASVAYVMLIVYDVQFNTEFIAEIR